MSVRFSTFVRRQTPESEFSHTTLTDEQVLSLVADNMHRAKPSYRKYDPETGLDDKGLLFGGVIAVPVPPEGFFSAICTLKEGDQFVGEYTARQPGEKPRKSTRIVGGEKSPAQSVDIILYHSIVLAEDSDDGRDDLTGWEIVSINASPEPEGVEVPINPGTLMHNHFHSSGGTSTGLSDSEFVAKLRVSHAYWQDKAMVGRKPV